jgi:hypothetical protein
MTAPIAPFLDIDLPLPDRRDGKVRVSYELPPGNDGERRRLFVTTDRLSAFDRIIAGVPYKGQVLNQLAAWWFAETADIVPNHVLSVPDPNRLVARSALWAWPNSSAPAAAGVQYRNFPLRGFKSETWEGGTRVPAFVHAPGRLPAGVRRRGLVHVTDWTPTLLALLGAAPPTDLDLDGLDVWPTLLSGADVRGELVVNINPIPGGQFGFPKAALVVGDMKVICWAYTIAGIGGANATSCRSVDRPGYPALFNVSADPLESNNLAAAQPDVLARLEVRLAELAAASVEPMQWSAPFQGPSYECANCPLHPAGTGPDVPWTAWVPDAPGAAAAAAEALAEAAAA